MSAHASRNYLYLLVFAAGFTTLAVELTASRLLDPWFGNSVIVWAALIGLIMLYLALGYWFGGRFADRSPNLVTLLRLAGLGALGVGLVPSVARPVLQIASAGFADFNLGLLAGSMAAVALLFAVPVTLLACVTPFALRLSLKDVNISGQVAGRLYALSTAGSILGSFVPVLVLIPNAGTRATFGAVAAALLAVVALGFLFTRRRAELLLTVLAAAFVAWLAFRPAGPIKPAPGLVFETESTFNYIQVLDAGFERQLRLNEGEGIHSVYRPPGMLADGIWDYFLLAPAFNPAPYRPEQVQRIALLGLAAGTMSDLYTQVYGPIPIDGVELDPAIIEAGRRYFDMTEPNLTAVAADARRFLRASEHRYDVIAVDVYRPPYIPFHLTTTEFFALASDHLQEDGVVVVNVGRTHTDFSLVDAIAATMGAVFPSVFIVDEPDEGSDLGNSMVVATRNRSTLADLQTNLAAFQHPMHVEVARRALPQARAAAPPPGTPVFTDDRAPVEQVVHALVFRYMLGQD